MDAQLTILDEIHARLENITAVNGYRHDVSANSIERAKLTPFKNGDLPAVNYYYGIDELEFKTGQLETRSFEVTIEGYTKNRDEPFTDISLRLGNDIITALFRSTSTPLTSDPISLALGGLVESITVSSQAPMIGEGQAPWCGVVLSLIVRYNVEVGNFDNIVKY